MPNRCIGLWVAGLLLAWLWLGCSDDKLHGAAPAVDSYWSGPEDVPPAGAGRTPIPEDDEIMVDFGPVTTGTVAHRHLFIRNSGRGDLVLAGLQVDPASSGDFLVACRRSGIYREGCPLSESEPLRVAPGGELALRFTYTPAEVGPDSGTVTLQLNTEVHSRLSIHLAGSGVVRDIEVCVRDCTGSDDLPECASAGWKCNDESGKENLLVDFGQVAVDVLVHRQVRVRNLGQLELEVNRLEKLPASAPAFALDLGAGDLPGLLGQGGESYFLVDYQPADAEQHLGRVRIVCDDGDEPEVQLELAGQGVAPRACPEPLTLDFGTVVTGQAAVQSFTIHNCGLLPLEVYGVALAGSPFSPDFSLVDAQAAQVTIPVGGSIDVPVQYLPAQDGSDAGGVDIFSNDLVADPDSHLTGTVQLFGRGLSLVCDLKVDPAAAQFGPVEIGSSGTVELVLSNSGNGPCSIDHLEITSNTPDGEFALAAGPAAGSSIDPAAGATVSLTYSPADHGPDTGILSIFVNDKDTDELRVDLNGFGAWPGGDGPVAVCSADPPAALPLSNVTWRGDQSYDTNGRQLTEYRWTKVSFPPGSAARLLGVGANRYSQVDLAGDYIAQLVVVNDLGQVSAPCTATTTVTPTQDLWIEMYWQHSGDDMDLHLLAPGGTPRTYSDCYFSNCIGRFFTPDWGQSGYDGDDPHLDMDDIPGTGPENINIADPADGVYTVFVNDYPGSSYDPANHVWVNVYIDGSLVASFENDLSGENNDWYVCQIDWPAGTVTPL